MAQRAVARRHLPRLQRCRRGGGWRQHRCRGGRRRRRREQDGGRGGHVAGGPLGAPNFSSTSQNLMWSLADRKVLQASKQQTHRWKEEEEEEEEDLSRTPKRSNLPLFGNLPKTFMFS